MLWGADLDRRPAADLLLQVRQGGGAGRRRGGAVFYGAAHGLNARLAEFAERLREHAVHAWSNLFAAALLRFTHSKHSLTFTAYALLADAVLSAVEGWALSRGYTWGEWLVVGTTACLIPFEIWALMHHVRVGRVVLLGLNLAIVAYLVINIRQRHARAARRYGY